MEKERLLNDNDGGLPPPAGLQKAEQVASQSRPQQSSFRRLATTLAYLALFLLVGSSAFRHFHRRLERERSGLWDASLNPDLRGSLTVKEAEAHFLTIPNNKSAHGTSKQYASLPHIAGSGQDFETAKSFLKLLQSEFDISTPEDIPVFDAGSSASQDATRGIPTRHKPSAWIDKYFPVMNYPLGRALDIVDDEGVAVWKADVEEAIEEGDPASEYAHTIGAWHGLSAPGDVTGPAVYVNYGRKKDFDELAAAGVNLTGTIAVVRYGAVFRGLKVKAAYEAGCIGTLIYTDPRDHGTVTEEEGYLPYPSGPAVNPHAVQRGSVQYLSSYPGDPTTPGFPAYENATRLEGGNIPQIPSLPISWANGLKILSEINSKDPFKFDGSKSSRRVRLLNQVDTKVIPIWNTMGVIPGHITDEVVILGNHRDAWVNGASDPSSGTVAMVEIVKGFGSLLRKGWRPLRTIVIASWDAEEYGLIGSTEFGEDFADFIKKHVVAYLNVDVASGGSRLHLGGSPSLAHLVKSSAQSVPHPYDVNRTLWDARDDKGPFHGNSSASFDSGHSSASLGSEQDSASLGSEQEPGADLFNAEMLRKEMDSSDVSTGVAPLGSGSDYTVFLQRIGIASIDGGFGGSLSDAVYHYHSVYDSVLWQEKYADPEYKRHVAMAKYLGLVALNLVDGIVLPINTTQYTLELGSYLAKVEALASSSSSLSSSSPDFAKLRKAITKLQSASKDLDHAKSKAEKTLRKALEKLSKGRKKEMCKRRRWGRVRRWVKRVFGVSSVEEREQREVENLKREQVHAHEKRGVDGRSAMEKMRVGMAGAGRWPAKKRDEVIEAQRQRRAVEEEFDEEIEEEEQEMTVEHSIDENFAHLVGFGGNILPYIWAATSSSPSTSNSTPTNPHLVVPPKLRKVFKAAKAVRAINAKLSSFERGFISEGGIKDREWYRHLGVAPGKWLGYGATTFPALTEALDERNSTLAKVETERLVVLLEGSVKALKK